MAASLWKMWCSTAYLNLTRLAVLHYYAAQGPKVSLVVESLLWVEALGEIAVPRIPLKPKGCFLNASYHWQECPSQRFLFHLREIKALAQTSSSSRQL